jgi:hypothetical protein
MNDMLLPEVEVLSCGIIKDAQDTHRRKNTFSMNQALAQNESLDYVGVSGLLTDVYAISLDDAFREFLAVGIHEVYVVRQSFSGSSGDKFEGESSWHATGGRILYTQHELQDTYYVSHTVEQEKSWQLGTKEFRHEGMLFGVWAPFTLCTAEDYSVVLWQYQAAKGIGSFKEYVNVDILDMEVEDAELARSELHKVTYIDRWGRTQELDVFASLYYQGLSRTALSEDTTYMLATIRHSLRTALTSPLYLKVYKFLGHKVAHETFCNTLRAIIDSKEYQNRAVQTWLSDFLKNYASWLKGICWFINFLFGVEYTPETLVANLLIGFRERRLRLEFMRAPLTILYAVS